MDGADSVAFDAVFGCALGVDVWAKEVKVDAIRKAAVQTERAEVWEYDEVFMLQLTH